MQHFVSRWEASSMLTLPFWNRKTEGIFRGILTSCSSNSESIEIKYGVNRWYFISICTVVQHRYIYFINTLAAVAGDLVNEKLKAWERYQLNCSLRKPTGYPDLSVKNTAVWALKFNFSENQEDWCVQAEY